MGYISQFLTRNLSILLLILCLCACGKNHELEKLKKLSQATSAIPRSIGSIDDGGFLSEKPCGPPCFMGITPGVSTQKDVYDALPKNGINLKNCVTDSSHDAGTNRESGGSEGEVLGCDSIAISFNPTDLVKSIMFTTDKTITMREVILKYGEPDAIQVVNLGVHVITSYVYIYYDEMRTELSFHSQEEKPNIAPDTVITTIRYEDEEEYNYYRQQSQAWLGYGKY